MNNMNNEERINGKYHRQRDLYNNLTHMLKKAKVREENMSVVVSINDSDKCSVLIMDESYKISIVETKWKNNASYFNLNESGMIEYYVESIDECIIEVKKFIDFVSANEAVVHTSKLSKDVTVEKFEKAYKAFIEQADKNAITKRAHGTKIPFGFKEIPKFGDASFKAEYGQGAPSAAPHMNYWCVSIYYLPDSGNIIMGIEEDRYSHLKEMRIKPISYEQIGNKKMKIAVFYSSTKNNINYSDLYECFISVCEEVDKLGLY